MRFTGVKTNAGGLRKLSAFFAVLSMVFLTAWINVSPASATTAGIQAKIYSGFNTTNVRPMDNPSVVSNYTYCKTQTMTAINNNWGSGDIEGCGGDYMLIHYTGYIYSSIAQTLYFRGYSDDGFWAKVGGTVVVNNWVLQGCNASGTGTGVTFSAGEYKAVDAWYYEYGGGACSQLYYSTAANGAYTPVGTNMYTLDNYAAVSLTDSTVSGQVAQNSSYSDQISASGSGTITYSVNTGALPPGLSLNSSTGAITGTATTVGSYNFSVRATAVDGGVTTTADTGTLTIAVGSAVTLTAGLTNQTLWIGEEYSADLEFAGSPAPTVTRASGTIPPGLSLTSSGTLSGTPTTSGIYTFAIKGTNFVNTVTSPSYTFTIQAAPQFTSATEYNQTVTKGSDFSAIPTVTGSGLTFEKVSGSLPAGLTLDVNSGAITGTPTQAGEFTFQIKATNRSGSATCATSTITVRAAPVFTANNVPTALQVLSGSDDPFRYTFASSGYPVPTFSVAIGTLPPGLSLNSETGVLSGRPTTGGSYQVTIRATNSLGHVDVTKTLVVSRAPRPVDISILLDILAGDDYLDEVEYEAFPTPTYSIVDGELPEGLELDRATGELSGIPTKGGLYNFKIRVDSGSAFSTSDNYALVVRQSPQLVDGRIVAKALSGKVYNDAVSATGYPVPTYSVTSGSLPAGLTLNQTTGALTGTPTVTGIYNFTITAANSVGTYQMPQSMQLQAAPKFAKFEFPNQLTLGQTVAAKVSASGFPVPTYRIASGSLPEGLTLDSGSGEINGTVTNGGDFTFTVIASNEAGNDLTTEVKGKIAGVDSKIALNAAIGDVVTGHEISIASEGLKPLVPYEIVLRSTPQVIGSGKTSSIGAVKEQAKIPGGLEPGWHSITLTSTNADGSAFEKAIYFQVTETLMLEEIAETPPTEAQKADALVNDPEFYARMGIDPASTVTPAAAAQQVETVTSVVASVAMVSAAAASVAAAAGAAAAGAAAGGAAAGGSAAGGARAGGAGASSSSSSSSSGGTRSSGGSSGGSSSTSSSSSSSSGDSGDSDSADYSNLEADHDDFESENAGSIDRLRIWRWRPLTAIDRVTANWVEETSRFSPVVSRIVNDGAYLQAMLGSLVLVGYFTAVALGVAAVDPTAQNMASSGRIGFLVAIMSLGMLDALAGALGMGVFTIASIAMYGISGVGDVRYLLSMLILGFAPSIMATTFRKIRRPAIENLRDAWERIIDLALIGFISVLTVMTLVGSVSAFAGATVPLAADMKPIAFVITAFALARVFLEEAAAKLAPARLDRINPTEVPGPASWQPWASLALKFGTLILMIGGMVGFGWHLFFGAVLIFLPGVIGMIWTDLPKVRWVHEFIPGGIGALAFATLISAYSGDLVNFLLGKSEMYGQLSFVLIPLPVILISIIGLFAKSDDKLWQRAGKRWIYIVGGIAVFLFTVQVTDFIPTIFG